MFEWISEHLFALAKTSRPAKRAKVIAVAESNFSLNEANLVNGDGAMNVDGSTDLHRIKQFVLQELLAASPAQWISTLLSWACRGLKRICTVSLHQQDANIEKIIYLRMQDPIVNMFTVVIVQVVRSANFVPENRHEDIFQLPTINQVLTQITGLLPLTNDDDHLGTAWLHAHLCTCFPDYAIDVFLNGCLLNLYVPGPVIKFLSVSCPVQLLNFVQTLFSKYISEEFIDSNWSRLVVRFLLLLAEKCPSVVDLLLPPLLDSMAARPGGAITTLCSMFRMEFQPKHAHPFPHHTQDINETSSSSFDMPLHQPVLNDSWISAESVISLMCKDCVYLCTPVAMQTMMLLFELAAIIPLGSGSITEHNLTKDGWAEKIQPSSLSLAVASSTSIFGGTQVPQELTVHARRVLDATLIFLHHGIIDTQEVRNITINSRGAINVIGDWGGDDGWG